MSVDSWDSTRKTPPRIQTRLSHTAVLLHLTSYRTSLVEGVCHIPRYFYIWRHTEQAWSRESVTYRGIFTFDVIQNKRGQGSQGSRSSWKNKNSLCKIRCKVNWLSESKFLHFWFLFWYLLLAGQNDLNKAHHHYHHHHHHYHLSFNREGRWGTTDDFATSFLHFVPVLHCPLGLGELSGLSIP